VLLRPVLARDREYRRGSWCWPADLALVVSESARW